MSFRTVSLLKIMDHTSTAKELVDNLEARILANEAINKKVFFSKIKSSLRNINISDAKEIEYRSEIITEFKSELSLEKIEAVVRSLLQSAISKIDPPVTSLAMNPSDIDAYVSMVNSVSEAAKSSSTAAANLKYSMNHLSPGVFVFLYASSVSIKDKQIFGSGVVISTVIYYRLMHSIEDVKNQAAFDALQIDKENYAKMKTLQTALLDDLANGKIDFETWQKLDAAYTRAAIQIKKRIEKTLLNSDEPRKPMGEKGSMENQKLVQKSIKNLSAKGTEIYKTAIQKSMVRLENSYF